MRIYEWNLYLFVGDMDVVCATPAATVTASPNYVYFVIDSKMLANINNIQ